MTEERNFINVLSLDNENLSHRSNKIENNLKHKDQSQNSELKNSEIIPESDLNSKNSNNNPNNQLNILVGKKNSPNKSHQLENITFNR